ncbi:MAG TPA: MFS transporter [Actinomycetota bacterium]|nr:MFS transporter [Actinomycetota bacterium]
MQGRRRTQRGGLRAALSLLGRNGDFARLYSAQLISFAGDWFATVALVGLVFDLTRSAAITALALSIQLLGFAVFTPLGGYLADRVDRKWLMVASDMTRSVLILGLLVVDRPGEVWLALAIVGAVSALGALFEPTSSASVPNLVDREDLPVANALVGSAWGMMLAVGGALGGLVAATLGRNAAFVGDAVSFALSAGLLVGIRRPFAEAREGREHAGMLGALAETFRYARRDHRVLALLTVKGGFGLGAGVIGLLPVFALEVFRAGDRGTGILFAFRGIGALIGPFLARRFTRDLAGVLLGCSVAMMTYGVFYSLFPLSGTLLVAAVLAMLAHLGGGAQWTLSTYGLQTVVPDFIRGRVFSFDYGLVTLTLALSIFVSGWAADQLGPRTVMYALAAVSIVYALVWTVLTRRIRRSAEG